MERARGGYQCLGDAGVDASTSSIWTCSPGCVWDGLIPEWPCLAQRSSQAHPALLGTLVPWLIMSQARVTPDRPKGWWLGSGFLETPILSQPRSKHGQKHLGKLSTHLQVSWEDTGNEVDSLQALTTHGEGRSPGNQGSSQHKCHSLGNFFSDDIRRYKE